MSATKECYAEDADGPYAFLACGCTACEQLQKAFKVLAEAQQARLRDEGIAP